MIESLLKELENAILKFFGDMRAQRILSLFRWIKETVINGMGWFVKLCSMTFVVLEAISLNLL